MRSERVAPSEPPVRVRCVDSVATLCEGCVRLLEIIKDLFQLLSLRAERADVALKGSL